MYESASFEVKQGPATKSGLSLAKERGLFAARAMTLASVAVLAACSGGASNGDAAGVTGAASAKAATSSSLLPVTIVGTAGTTVTMTFSAPAGNWAKRVSLQVNNRNAQVQLNNGAWIDLSDSAVSVDATSGSLSTVSFAASNGIGGANMLRMRLKKGDSSATGFQARTIGMLDANNKQLIDTSTFAEAPTAITAATPLPMPLHLIGTAGSTLSASFTAAAGNWAKRLSLQVSSRTASVQLNNGSWVDLGSSAISVDATASGLTTVSLPVGNAVAGANVVRFKLKSDSTATPGFQVSSLKLVDASGKQLIDSTALSTAPTTSTTSTASTVAGATTTTPATATSPVTVIPVAAPTAATPVASGAASSTVTLPLEIMGDTGTVVTANVYVPAGSSAAKLYMQVNNLSYDNKASIQINGGAWINLTNASVSVQGAGKAYGGIGGGFDTIKLTVPITGAVTGNNKIAFRFNGTDGVSSGFRVLAFNLQDSSSNNLIPASSFVQDDPTKWTLPSNAATSADIAAGEQLWKTATLAEAPGKQNLQAHCMDCHSYNGYDLHRFNYSNYSIISRAKFHGLSATQGAQIAGYIRNLTAQYGVPGNKCRPWNPPYQPGAGLDSGDVKNWTCGAGLDAVVENDLDTLKTLFPEGSDRSKISTTGNVNAREIPIGLQLPDWNHWMPRVHPIDAWGSYFQNSNLLKAYNGTGGGNETYNMTAKLASGGASYVTNPNSSFQTDLYYWGVDYGERFQPSTMGTPYQYTIKQQENIYGTVLWQLSKLWELTQLNNLETLCPELYANLGAPAAKIEKRSWCGQWRFAFDVSPHIQKFPEANSMFGSAVGHYTKANQWYQVSLLLNPGSGIHSDHLPLDWQYAYGLIDDLSNASGRLEPARNLLYILKGAQAMDNGIGPNKVDHGWTVRDSSPLDVWKSGQNGIWKGTDVATEKRVVNAFVQNWLDTTTSFNISSWQRMGAANDNGDSSCGWSMRELCWSDYAPGQLRGNSPTLENFPNWTFKQIPEMRAEGIDGNQLNRFAQWMNTAYPKGNYLSLVK
jgi:hypothetical protein